MKISKLHPDDPRLTAYALGELDAAEQVAVEAAIKHDPEAQAVVAQVRALGGNLSAALAKEPLPFVVPPPQLKDAHPPAREIYHPRAFWRLPFYLAGGAVAAGFFALIVVQKQEVAKQDARVAQIRAEALQQRKMAREMAKLEARSRGLVEIELKDDSESVVHLPAVAGNTDEKAKSVAQNEMYPRVVELDPMKVEGTREGFAKAAVQTGSTVQTTFADDIGGRSNVTGSLARSQVRSKEAKSDQQVVAAAKPLEEETIVLSPFSVSKSPKSKPRFAAKSTPAAPEVQGRLARVVASDAFAASSPAGVIISADKPFDTEAYDRIVDNEFLGTTDNPLSTFSIDVDTASYTNLRRFLTRGQRPPRDAVRIEEMVNYFPYDYAAPKDDRPFATSMEVASAPWNPEHRLVRIGLKGREVPDSERPALNLVFLLDVSGSMNEPNKLPLVKESMRLLVEKLKPADRVAIVVYAGASGLALPSTPAAQKQEILSAIDELRAGGSTNGALGIQLAYDIAKANFIKDGANRVVLCTDGDFNVGVTNNGDLTRLIEDKAKSGVFLTALGFGRGNLKDATLEKLADKGNGNYGYVDTFAEAKKLLSDQLSGTLVTIAKDVKIQVEFNPAIVKSYRLIGYENRMLKKEDFNNDKIDAGEIGAGHTVTALYEVVPVGVVSPVETPEVDGLKYQDVNARKGVASSEMLTLKVRYKAPDGVASNKLEFPLIDQGTKFADASQDFKFTAAVAGFGMLLRESPHKGTASFEAVLGWAESGTGQDNGGYRREFQDLVKKAKGISG